MFDAKNKKGACDEERPDDLDARPHVAEEEEDQDAHAEEGEEGGPRTLGLDVGEEIREDDVLAGGVDQSSVNRNVAHPLDESFQVRSQLELRLRAGGDAGDLADGAVPLAELVDEPLRSVLHRDRGLRRELVAHFPHARAQHRVEP